MHNFLSALRFLTTLPLPENQDQSSGFGRMGLWFPVVGALIGIILLLADSISSVLFTADLRAALVLALWVLLTGGLHLDGLGDCCDAFFAAVTPQRRLEILKDVHMGTFGICGITLVLIVKFAALSANPAVLPYGIDLQLRWGLILSPVLARWGVLIAALRPRARPDGMGAAFARDLNPGTAFLAGILPLLLVIWLGWQAVVSAIALAMAVAGICAWSERKIGGVTGDVLGMTIEIGETLVLILLSVGIWR